MKNTYTFPTHSLPTQALALFDTAILTARLHMMVALTLTLLDIEWMDAGGVIAKKRLQRRCMKRVKHITSRVRRVSAAILKVKVHNILLERKLDMLRTPDWRARVLKDLGGMERLKSWDAAWLKHLTGDMPKPKTKPEKPQPAKSEPMWWRSPERVAESERLKARFRLCEKACVNPRTFKDPFKVDFEGEFRLAPIARGKTSGERLPRIYSKVDICEYGYDAMPIWKDFGVGVSLVYPMEFYAAMILEGEDIANLEGIVSNVIPLTSDMFPSMVDFAPQNPRDTGSHEVGSCSKAFGLDWKQGLRSANDNHALIEFIGRKNYKYIFENPG